MGLKKIPTAQEITPGAIRRKVSEGPAEGNPAAANLKFKDSSRPSEDLDVNTARALGRADLSIGTIETQHRRIACI